MTFGEKLSHVAKDDPKFARSVRRIRIASAVFGIAVVVALAFAIWSLAIGFSNKTQITKIESPCLRYGAKSEQCKEAFEQAVLTITHAEACAILRKAGIAIQPCAHARLRQEHQRGKERAQTARATAIHQPSHKAHQHPSSPTSHGQVEAGKGGGAHHEAPGHGGGTDTPAQPNTPSVPDQSSPGSSGASTSSPSPGNSASSKANPIAEGAGSLVEGAHGVVSETGHTANEAVGNTAEGAQGKTYEALGMGC